MLRAMILAFPDDPACDTLDRQYMLGDSLLVAPVFCPDGLVDYYLPTGRWTNFLTGLVVEGGRWVRERHGYLTLPLMARPNSVIAVGANDQRPDYEFAEGVKFHIFEIEDGREDQGIVPALDGRPALTVSVRRVKEQVTVEVSDTGVAWPVVLRGRDTIMAVDGGQAEPGELGTQIMPNTGVQKVTVTL